MKQFQKISINLFYNNKQTMVFENGAYGIFANATSIIKTLYNTCTSGIRKNASMSKDHVKLNMSQTNDTRNENKSGLKCINRKPNICNDTKIIFIYKKRCKAEVSKVRKKRKTVFYKDLSCGYCKRHRTVSSGYKNAMISTSNSYNGCNSNRRPIPNALGVKLNNNSHSTHNLNMQLYRNLSNIKIASESSIKHCGRPKDQKNTRKTSFKRPDAKLVSAVDWNNKRKVKNTQKCSKKYNKNTGEFIFSYDKINKHTRLKNN
ncbi:hypothetical protein COBT_003299 [Conglomerata obtusa]